ncbi:MAG: pilin [bacterium]
MSARGFMKKNDKKVIIITMLAVFFCFAVFLIIVGIDFANAQMQTATTGTISQGVEVIEEPLGLPSTDIRLIVARIIRAALGLLGIVTVSIITYGGFLWMTAGGNEEQIGRAKKVLINAVIGLAIILSAFAIVSFIISSLIAATTGVSPGPQSKGSTVERFSGSGALGRIIRDHYPMRNQTKVPRNTKIVVTFSRPVQPSSFIEDTTGDGIFGNCVQNMTSWVNDCDRIKAVTTTVSGTQIKLLQNNIINIKNTKTGESIEAAAILASTSTINNITGVYTIVIRPLTDTSLSSGGYLGSEKEEVGYTVRLGSSILLDDPGNPNQSIFDSKIVGNDYYEWNFTCDTSLDMSPPYVKSVYPKAGQQAFKNSVIQIDFNEAMDPIGIQGGFTFMAGSSFYTLLGNNIFLNSKNSSMPIGSFTLSNGYRTLEFVSTQECGKNACGKNIYCLPVCDQQGANCSTITEKGETVEIDSYELLLKTATTINTTTWESIPFSGIMDICGNALDGNANQKLEVPDNTKNKGPFSISRDPDNYNWAFTIKDSIDLSAPYLYKIVPGVNADLVPKSQEISMDFSKRLRAGSIYNIDIEEVQIGTSITNIPIWHVPRLEFRTSTAYTPNEYSYVKVDHGDFLALSDYYPVVTSDVEDVNFNCFYPGMGPNKQSTAVNKSSAGICESSGSNIGNCCQVSTTTGKDFCCNGVVGGAINPKSNTVSSCLDYIK